MRFEDLSGISSVILATDGLAGISDEWPYLRCWRVSECANGRESTTLRSSNWCFKALSQGTKLPQSQVLFEDQGETFDRVLERYNAHRIKSTRKVSANDDSCRGHPHPSSTETEFMELQDSSVDGGEAEGGILMNCGDSSEDAADIDGNLEQHLNSESEEDADVLIKIRNRRLERVEADSLALGVDPIPRLVHRLADDTSDSD